MFRLKSLSEDNVDSITHTWSFVLFIILSLLLLVVIPPSQRHRESQDDSKYDNPAAYEANCWCPAQFEDSQVRYTNKVCGKEIYDFLQGNKSKAFHYQSNPYDWPLVTDPITTESSNKSTSPNDSNTKDDPKEENELMKSLGVNSPPVLLLLLAIGLRLPRILMLMMNQGSDSFNMEETLQAAQRCEEMSRGQRREFYKDLITPLMRRSSCLKNYSCLYSLMKLLTICVISIEIVVVHKHAIPKLEQRNQQEMNNTRMTTVEPDIYHCYFDIRRNAEVYSYTVQCSYQEKDTQSQDESPLHIDQGISTKNALMAVFTSLCCLLVINIFNTIFKTFSFFFVCDSKVPSDVKLLLHMARLNLSIHMVSDLSDAIGGASQQSNNDKQLL